MTELVCVDGQTTEQEVTSEWLEGLISLYNMKSFCWLSLRRKVVASLVWEQLPGQNADVSVLVLRKQLVLVLKLRRVGLDGD